jgi:hypothetical protein
MNHKESPRKETSEYTERHWNYSEGKYCIIEPQRGEGLEQIVLDVDVHREAWTLSVYVYIEDYHF